VTIEVTTPVRKRLIGKEKLHKIGLDI